MEIKCSKSNEIFKSYKLKQITDLIQFQAYDYESSESKPYLRASEVKPKLDKFIYNFLLKNLKKADGTVTINNDDKLSNIADKDDEIVKKELNRYLKERDMIISEETLSFNYSMRIEVDENDEFIVDDWKENKNDAPRDPSGLYFALIKFDGTDTKYPRKVFCETSYLKIYYKQKKDTDTNIFVDGENKNSLQQLVEFCLPYFFELTNFGARSSKGYGSFKYADSHNFKQEILNIFTDFNFYYKITSNNNKLTKDQKLYLCWFISSTMKSGINIKSRDKKFKYYVKGAIITYFLKKGIKSDKAFIKSNNSDFVTGIDNCENKENLKADSSSNYEYVRGLLGVCSTARWKCMDNTKRKYNKTVTYKNKKIERYSSPIVLKPLDNEILVIPNEIPQEVLGASFKLNIIEKRIKIPEKFDIEDFLDYYKAEYIDNDKSEDCIYNVDYESIKSSDLMKCVFESINHENSSNSKKGKLTMESTKK